MWSLNKVELGHGQESLKNSGLGNLDKFHKAPKVNESFCRLLNKTSLRLALP